MKKALLSAACIAGAALTSTASAQEPTSPPVSPPAPAPAVAAAAPAPGPTHTVARGEYLWKISEARLGAGGRWVELFAFNQDVLQNPNQVEVGQVLKIPTAPVPVPPEVLAGVAGAPAASTRGTVTRASSAGSDSAGSSRSSSRGSSSGGSSSGGSRGGGGGGGDGYLASIRACESGGDYGYNDGTYKGAYNFDDQTWRSVGGSGTADQASAAEQDARASQLLAQRGSSPWPNCG